MMKGALHSQNFTGSHSEPLTSEAFEKMFETWKTDASKANIVVRGNDRTMANANRDGGPATFGCVTHTWHSWMVLWASAASQMLWQQAETKALTARLRPPPGCADPVGGLTKTHYHNHNRHFTHAPELWTSFLMSLVLLDQTDTFSLLKMNPI